MSARFENEFTLRDVLRELGSERADLEFTRYPGEPDDTFRYRVTRYAQHTVERALLRSHLVRVVACAVCGEQFNGISIGNVNIDSGEDFHKLGDCAHPHGAVWRLEPGVGFEQLMGVLRVALDG